jgi:hypothetical protein
VTKHSSFASEIIVAKYAPFLVVCANRRRLVGTLV